MHYMIDTETLGLSIKGPIIQLGVIAFDASREGGYSERGEFLVNIDLLSLLLAGYDVEPKTLNWWRDQKFSVRRALHEPAPILVSAALSAFVDFFASFPMEEIEGVWSHGAGFDLPRVAELLRSGGYAPAWDYRLERCSRTLFKLAEEKGFGREPAPALQHNALADARWQARDVCRALGVMNGSVTL